ncbi:hypothetical protein V1527DRAFT_502447 [Lipomyces starkeyi]
MAIGGSVDRESQAKSLEQLKSDFAAEPVNYFLSQWWENGQCERWAEMHIQNHLNFGISITSRVEGSHGAIKRGLTSSSGTLYTAGKELNRRGIERAQHLSVEESNEALFVRLEIRNEIETSKLCTTISRSALGLVYAEVLNMESLPSAVATHRIQLVPISITEIDPRWWVHPEFPPVNVAFQHIDAAILLELKDPAATLPRKGRPKGTRRLQTSAEVVQKFADRIEKVRRCGSCKNTGHDRRKCPKLLSNLMTTDNEATAIEH